MGVSEGAKDLTALHQQVFHHPTRGGVIRNGGWFSIMGKMESTNEAVVKGKGLIVQVQLPRIALAMRYRFVFLQPGVYALQSQRQGQDQQQAEGCKNAIWR